MIYECNMAIVDQMDGFEFEEFVARLLRHNGYREVDVTPASGDKGADVIAISPDGRRTCFQCKHYAGNVGTAAVQEVLAVMRYYNCSQAVVITNAQYTRQARELAQQTGVYLMDYSWISALMENCIAECVNAVKDPRKYLDRIRKAREQAAEQFYNSL